MLPVLRAVFLVVQAQTAGAPTPRTPLIENLGKLHHAISTKVPQAQQYFDQGLLLTYGFNHEEAINSFREAARLDSTCAICYWGIAFAFGPNINIPMDPSVNTQALDAVREARARLSYASPLERAYIEAIATRYSADTTTPRASLDTAYANAARDLWSRLPTDDDAGALYADALMNLAPWNYWQSDGAARPGTQTIVATLEQILKRNPNHIGACHFYIHAVEASFQPQRALPCAERLPGLAPGAGHLVHMPAHIYMRVGRYADAVTANEHAAHSDETFIERRHPTGFYPVYYFHNLHFLWAASQMEGRSAEALRAARDLAKSVPPELIATVPSLEYLVPTPLFALVQFGKWDDVLAEPQPSESLRYTRAIWHYARGRALSAQGKPDQADDELDSLTTIRVAIKDLSLGFQNAGSLLGVAAHALRGEIAAQRGDTAMAVRELEEAVRLQDALVYDEPPPWYYPVRQTLGATLLAAGRGAEAEAVYREDLKRNPENGWSLFGLARTLAGQGKAADAAAVDKRFRRAWARADVVLKPSGF
jgi:tetratricopeptide (TPR) repeat protein